MNEKKRTVLKRAILVLVVLMVAEIGRLSQYAYQVEMPSNKVYTYALGNALLGILITGVLLMVIPFGVYLIKKGRLPYSVGRNLCIGNSAGIFILTWWLAGSTDLPISGMGWGIAIVFFFINNCLFVAEK